MGVVIVICLALATLYIPLENRGFVVTLTWRSVAEMIELARRVHSKGFVKGDKSRK